jgi:hypothetical protein
MLVNRFMRNVLFGVVLLAIIVAAWSQDLPHLAAPKGFIESSGLVPALKDQALVGHPARTRLIGVYLLPDELANILHGAPEHMTILCRAYVNDELASEDEAKVFFRRLVAGAKQEASKRFDPTDPDVRRIIQRYVDATKERQGVSVGITGATILGSILETEDVYATSMVAAMSAQTSQGQTSIPLAATVAWLRRGKQILELSDVTQFQGAQSITTANDVVEDWVRSNMLSGP